MSDVSPESGVGAGLATEPTNGLARQLLAAGQLHARRQQVHPDLVEDCAGEFVLYLLLRYVRDAHVLPPLDACGHCPARWLHRAAINHVKNFRRDQMRRDYGTVLWADLAASCAASHGSDSHRDAIVTASGALVSDLGDGSGGVVDLQDLPDPAAPHDLDSFLLLAEFRRCVEAALLRLPAEARLLFLRHCSDGETLVEIGASLGKSPDAVRKSVARARAQLQRLLERQGVTHADLCAYLSPDGHGLPPALPRKDFQK